MVGSQECQLLHHWKLAAELMFGNAVTVALWKLDSKAPDRLKSWMVVFTWPQAIASPDRRDDEAD